MWTSPKRYLLTTEGVKEAGPGISGTLIVGEGCQITEDRARQFGLLPPKNEMPQKKPMVEPIIVRGPEGEVQVNAEKDTGKVSVVTPSPSEQPAESQQSLPTTDSPHATEGGFTTEAASAKPWETPSAPAETTNTTVPAQPALDLTNE